MSFAGLFVLVLVICFVGSGLVSIVKAFRTPGGRPWRTLLFGLLFFYGFGAFFCQGAGATGALAFVPASVEFPVWRPETVVRTTRELTFVGLVPMGRVQVYDSGGRFLRGFFVDAGGGPFTIQPAADGRILVRSHRTGRHLYDDRGQPADAPTNMAEALLSEKPPAYVAWSAPWWPMASPFLAWVVGVVGMLGMKNGLVEKLREQWRPRAR